MEAPRVIPCLLLSGDRLVKTSGFAQPQYVGDPVNVLNIFNSFEVDELFLLDIDGARRRSPSEVDSLRHFAEECFIPLAFGGGLTNIGQVESILACGYEKVVLGTAVADDPGLIEAAAQQFGSQAIVVAIDVAGSGAERDVVVRGGTVAVGSSPEAWARRVESLGAGEILLTSVDREGTMSGFDLDLIEAVAGSVNVPVVAHGGAARRKDLPDPIRRGASAVAAGSLFVFQGSGRGVLINYPTRAQLERLMQP